MDAREQPLDAREQGLERAIRIMQIYMVTLLLVAGLWILFRDYL